MQRRLHLLSALLAAGLVATGCASGDGSGDFSPDPDDSLPIRLEKIASGFGAPLLAVSPGDRRLFVVERPGRVWRIDGGRRQLYLDISDRISEGGERGLLGLAFHPRFGANGRVFINYTDRRGDTRLDELKADPGARRLDADDRVELLRVDQPEANHNGGHLAFGPDGYLYVGLGDGGGGGDPHDNGQNTSTPLGAILRIDVDRVEPGRSFGIPDSNPFAAGEGAPEVFVYGLRNPWRFSFDAPRGDLWIGDVGQDRREEITVLRRGTAGGANLGWPLREGSLRNRDEPEHDTVSPIVEYSHDVGCSVTGGVVYRGDEIAALAGRYVFGDYCTGRLFSLDAIDPEGTLGELLPQGGGPVPFLRSFGTDPAGRLYTVAGDAVYLISAAGPSSGRRPPAAR